MVISSRNREILKKNRFYFFFVPHKSLVIFAKNREIPKNSEKKCVLFLQKSLVICARNRWNPNENPKICLEKSLGISTKNQRNLKFLCFFHSRNHWWFPRKIYKFRIKSVYLSCRNHWWFLQKIDEILENSEKKCV